MWEFNMIKDKVHVCIPQNMCPSSYQHATVITLCIPQHMYAYNKIIIEDNIYLYAPNNKMLEICPRDNNKVVIIYLYVYDKCLHTML